MTKEDFAFLRWSVCSGGKPLKQSLREHGISCSTYYYWHKKFVLESATPAMAPIALSYTEQSMFGSFLDKDINQESQRLCGVTLTFPNGLRAHLGSDSERVLMDVFNICLSCHVLP